MNTRHPWVRCSSLAMEPPARGDLLGVGGWAIEKRTGSMMLLQSEIQTWQEKQGHMEGHWETLTFKVWN